MNINEVYEKFRLFMIDISDRLDNIGISIYDYPIDHVCFRVTSKNEYSKYFEIFKKESMLHAYKFFHERYFNLFVLKKPFKWDGIEIPYLEFSEPGGSDNYNLGFQHIEFHTNKRLENMVANRKVYLKYRYAGKYDGEEYLKWDDKITVKITKKAIITKFMLEDKPEIVILR